MNLAELNKAVTGNSGSSVPANIAKLAAVLNQAVQPSQNNSSQVYSGTPNTSPARNQMAKIQASIKAERTSQGMTQRDLAAKCGMSQGTITRAERHGWISIWCLLRIADALGKEIKLT